MKKILLVLSLVFAAMAVNAQVYVGGSLGYSSETEKDDNGDKLSSISNFTFGPKIGYGLNDNFSVGLEFLIGSAVDKSYIGNTETKITNSYWKVAPFARYTVAEFGKFSVLGEGQIYFAGTKNDVTDIKGSAFGLSVKPILSFAASDNFSLEAILNLVKLEYYNSKANTDVDATTSSFDFGVGSNDLMNTSPIAIGFIYKF